MAQGNQFADRGMPEGIDSSPGVIRSRYGDRNYLAGASSGQSKQPEVNTPSHEYDEMLPRWDIIDTVLGGTAEMRDAGEKYLPRHPYETNEAYKERLSRATLKNYTLRTLENLVSKAFRDPPKPTDDVPKDLLNLLEDVDAEGTSFHVFTRAWMRLGIRRAMAYVLVDHTRGPPNPDGSPRTLADDRRDGLRPFWRLVDPKDVIYLRHGKLSDGKSFGIVHARIVECTKVEDGWGEKEQVRIRVLTPGAYELFELQQVKGRKQKWVSVEKGAMDVKDVPLIPFHTNKHELGEGKPPLEDLAYLNVEHFQSSADQRSILTVARFPILAVSGAANVDPNGEPIVIGPKKWLSVADANGRIYYVEHKGEAIAAGRVDLEDLEDQMASYGSEFLRKRPGASSATGRALDSAEAISPLMAWGMDFKFAIERVFKVTAEWLRLDTYGKVLYEVKPDVTVGESKELDALDKARERRDLSRKTYLDELQRRGILSPEFDADGDMKLIESEPQVDQAGFSATITSTGGKRGPVRTTGEPPLAKPGG